MVYFFDEGRGRDKKLLGGKGSGLCEMTQMGLPVPPGFVITTEVCKEYYGSKKRLPEGLAADIRRSVSRLEKETGKGWNSPENPLLVSVRSGAAISMPGMMDTVLNLGLNDDTVEGLAAAGGARFAWDSYRRFVQLFGKVVFGVDDKRFEDVLDGAKRAQGAASDGDLSEESLRGVVSEYKDICRRHTGSGFPSDPDEQLILAVTAVFDSWMGERAIVYRREYGITPDVADGTAVNVVAMVFGNTGESSATGVVFTRNPGNGEKRIFGEYLVNAQGEDVVAGTRTPKPVSSMREEMPDTYAQLERTCDTLEGHYGEPQDIEFTVERGRFYLLQTRNAKMNGVSMIRTSVEMVREGLMDRNGALLRLREEHLEQLLHRTIDGQAAEGHRTFVQGIAASPGAASGVAMFDVKRAVKAAGEGASVILVREETKPEDVPAFFSSLGILTSRGGKTSHAAVVARGMGKPCIVGASDMAIDYDSRRCTAGDIAVSEGDRITIDGSSGTVYLGDVPTVEPAITDDFRTVLEWAGGAKRLGVRANADTPQAASIARGYGAEGIGLCRTERMFNAEDRIGVFVDMIMSKSEESRKGTLEKLGRLQRSDFVEILRVMEGFPVTIRLLDPPLHEFLPDPRELAEQLRGASGSAASRIKSVLQRAEDLAETNPMMGHRGVRLGVTFPAIYEMQIRAVFDAAADLAEGGVDARPQIMVPQVGSVEELDYIKSIYDRVKGEVLRERKSVPEISFGTMIEVVRAALVAERLACTAGFFSFGTNDLTQAVFSFSREDAEGKFLPQYLEAKLLDDSPFQSVDSDGVGGLMRIGIEGGRRAKPGLEVGVCGEHGGDPASILFFDGIGVSYVSASPHRIPMAIISAAQSSIEKGASA